MRCYYCKVEVRYHDEDLERCLAHDMLLKMLAVITIHSFLKNMLLVSTSCTELIDIGECPSGTEGALPKFTAKDMKGGIDVSRAFTWLLATCCDHESLGQSCKGLTVAGGGADALQRVHTGVTWPCQLFKAGTQLIGLRLTHASCQCFHCNSWRQVVCGKCDKRP